MYTETDALCPLGVYRQTKAAGGAVVATTPHHYILRTSRVIGEGNNFFRTMATLAENAVTPSVVNDQKGRTTVTADLAKLSGTQRLKSSVGGLQHNEIR